ncbi:MAG: hypothetical protein WAO23_03690 [Dethiobacteria bacterium]
MRFKTEKEETVHIIGRIVITAEVLNLIITPLAARLEMIEKIVFAIEDDDLKVYVQGKYKMFPFKALYNIKISTLVFNTDELKLSFSFGEKVHSNSWTVNLIMKQISRGGSFLERFTKKRDGISVTDDEVYVDFGALLKISREEIIKKMGRDLFSMVSLEPVGKGESFFIDIGITEAGLRELVSTGVDDGGEEK